MSAIDFLNFGSKTTERVIWESFEFRLVGKNKVEVTNASYGDEKKDHRYTVRIVKRDGVALPAHCDCPADKYNDKYDCKHKVALATVGGHTVLNAAVEYDDPVKAEKKPIQG